MRRKSRKKEKKGEKERIKQKKEKENKKEKERDHWFSSPYYFVSQSFKIYPSALKPGLETSRPKILEPQSVKPQNQHKTFQIRPKVP